VTSLVGELQEEIAFLAMTLHWSLDDLLDLEHGDRRAFIAHASRLSGAGGR
jgi:hypothetical protein